MLVIQHRVNSPLSLGTNLYHLKSKFVEVDVHIKYNGEVVVKHSPDDRHSELPIKDYFKAMEYPYLPNHVDKYFVDIKQNMDVYYLKKIVNIFGDKLLGLFDVPFPSSFYANKAGLPIYRRISEYEANDTTF